MRITYGEDGKTLWSRLLSNRLVQGACTTRTIARNQQRAEVLTSLPHGPIRCIYGQLNIFEFNKLKLKSHRHVDPSR